MISILFCSRWADRAGTCRLQGFGLLWFSIGASFLAALCSIQIRIPFSKLPFQGPGKAPARPQFDLSEAPGPAFNFTSWGARRGKIEIPRDAVKLSVPPILARFNQAPALPSILRVRGPGEVKLSHDFGLGWRPGRSKIRPEFGVGGTTLLHRQPHFINTPPPSREPGSRQSGLRRTQCPQPRNIKHPWIFNRSHKPGKIEHPWRLNLSPKPGKIEHPCRLNPSPKPSKIEHPWRLNLSPKPGKIDTPGGYIQAPNQVQLNTPAVKSKPQTK